MRNPGPPQLVDFEVKSSRHRINPQRKSDSPKALIPLKRSHALLDCGQLSDMAEEAAQDLMAEGESDNTRLAYRAAMRYWAAWFGARYGRQMALPVPVPVVVQFIVDHAERSTKAGLEHQLPSAIDEALVEAGFKGKLGAPALNTLMHRISVLSMAHHLSKQPNPCMDAAVKALLSKTRKAYAKRNALPHKQRALTKEPLEAVLETCDDSLKHDRLPHVLIVETMGESAFSAVYGWGDSASQWTNIRKGWRRIYGTPEPGTLRARLSNSITVEYELKPDGTLSGTYTNRGVVSKATMSKVKAETPR
ncbi:MAG: hypothetical protein EOP82_00940 [Variovorax sp.]|nr:MAG: hypothetical protein EOP82_00940 [Variovorax sp.]